MEAKRVAPAVKAHRSNGHPVQTQEASEPVPTVTFAMHIPGMRPDPSADGPGRFLLDGVPVLAEVPYGDIDALLRTVKGLDPRDAEAAVEAMAVELHKRMLARHLADRIVSAYSL